MDVLLPDGTVVKDVPDGTSKAELTAKLKANGYDVSQLVEPPSTLDKTLGIVKYALKNTGPGAVIQASGLPALLQGDVQGVARAPATRFAVGAAEGATEPVRGLFQRLGVDTPSTFDEYNQMVNPSGGTDYWKSAGVALNPLGLTVGKAITPASTLLGQTGQAVALGGASGFLHPASDNWEAAKNALYSAATAGVLPSVFRLGAGVWNIGKEHIPTIADLFRKGGAERIGAKIIQENVGEQNMPTLIQQSKTAPDILPGGSPTLAQSTAGNPLASPLSAIEEKVASIPLQSAKFGQRWEDQKQAVDAAKAVRDAIAAPIRDQAIQAARSVGGVAGRPVIAAIDAELAVPEQGASKVVRSGLNDIKNSVSRMIDKDTGLIDPGALYTIRKEIGNTIKAIANKQQIKFDEGMVSRIETGIQKTIDAEMNNAINAAKVPQVAPGVTVWDKYLSDYSKASQNIRDFLDRAELAKNPLQKTNLGTGAFSRETNPPVPHLISQKVALANWALKLVGKDIEPEVNSVVADIMLNPKNLDVAMSKLTPIQKLKAEDVLRVANVLSFNAPERPQNALNMQQVSQ